MGLTAKSPFPLYKFTKKVKSLSHVQLFTTPWIVACQAPLFMGFSRQEYWSGLPLPSPGDLPDPGIGPGSSTLQADFLLSEPPGQPRSSQTIYLVMSLIIFFIIYLEFVGSNFIPLLKWNLICFSSLVFPRGSAGKESVCNVGGLGFDPWVGKILWRRERLPTQYSGLENSMDCIVHGVANSWAYNMLNNNS